MKKYFYLFLWIIFFAISLDTSSGNLNNLLFLKSKWWELASFSEEEQIIIIGKLESLFNIGIVMPIKENRPCCIIDEQSSLDYLLSIYLNFTGDILFNYHGQAEKLLHNYPAFKHEQNLFNIVVDLPIDTKEKNISIIKNKVKEMLVKFTNDNIEHTLSLEEFFSLINKQRNILKNHIKGSPIII